MARTLADMTPEGAQGYLIAMAEQQASTLAPWVIRSALQTIAAMSEEVDYRIVNPEENGGKYKTRKWTRMVAEWKEDPSG